METSFTSKGEEIDLFTELSRGFSDLLKVIEQMADYTTEMITTINKRRQDKNITGVSGASASILGSIMIIGGVALSPFTAGGSLGLSVAGGVLCLAGGATAAGGSLAEWVFNQKTAKELALVCQRECVIRESILGTLQALEKRELNCINEYPIEISYKGESRIINLEFFLNLLSILLVVPQIQVRVFGTVLSDSHHKIDPAKFLAFTDGAKFGVSAARLVMNGAGTAGKVVKIGGVVVTVFTLPIDIYCLSTDAIKVHKKTPHEVAGMLQQFVTELRAIIRNVDTELQNESALEEGGL